MQRVHVACLSSVARMTGLHTRYGLSRVINASGTYTPLGVSRSSAQVASAAAEALTGFFVIDELQALASRTIAQFSGAQAGVVTHCASAGITLAVAAAMTGDDPGRIVALPDTRGLRSRVVIPAGHAVDYGHPILTDIRLAGATPLVAGTEGGCTLAELEDRLASADVACLLLVSSRLVRGAPLDLAAAVACAHRHGLPAIIDGAAQDMRIDALLATGADLVIVSAQKYLAAPTAGLVIGRAALVRAVRAQEKGIGRAMKATKEAILGCLAALEERRALDLDAWRALQARKVGDFVARAEALPGIRAAAQPDAAGMPFARVVLSVESGRLAAAALARALRDGRPSVRVMEHALAQQQLVLELVPLGEDEIELILGRLAELLAG